MTRNYKVIGTCIQATGDRKVGDTWECVRDDQTGYLMDLVEADKVQANLSDWHSKYATYEIVRATGSDMALERPYHLRVRLMNPGAKTDWDRRTLLQMTLGTFNSSEEAHEARKAAEACEPGVLTKIKALNTSEGIITEYFVAFI